MSSLKQMFHKDSTVSSSLLAQSFMQQSDLLAVVRQSINTPVTMLGVALSFGASVPLMSPPEPVLAADGFVGSTAGVGQVPSDSGDSATAAAYYTVKSGDSLWQIAKQHDADVKVLRIVNGIFQDEVLRVGQVLKVPAADTSSASRVDGSPRLALAGVGGELPSEPSVDSSLTLRSAEQLKSDWSNVPQLPTSISTQASQGEPSAEGLSVEAHLPETNESASAPSAAETLVSFSSTGALVPVNYPVAVSSSAASSWVDNAVQGSQLGQKGNTESATSESGSTSYTHLQVAQLSSKTDPKSLALALSDTANLVQDQRIRDTLARIRGLNAVTIDRNQLNAKLALARQNLEHTGTTSSESTLRLSSLTDSTEPSTVNSPSLSTATDKNSTTASAADASGWQVTDAAEVSSTSARLAKFSNSEADMVGTDHSPLNNVDSQHLTAVAPLNPDIYRSSPNASMGETVIPGMPMLPGAGEFLPEAPAADSNGYVWPARGVFTSGYGWRWGRMHRGIDIAGPVGTPVIAAASGVVVRAGWNSGGYGNVVDIRHRDGSMTRYAHNSRLLVREGQEVRQGQSIAQIGSTGYSTGPHVHFEIHLPGSGTVNPIAYLPSR